MTPHGPGETSEAILGQQGWLRRLARELVWDEAAAEDLVQETTLAALAHPPRNEGALRTWLRTVLVHRARDRARAEGRRRSREELVARPEAVAGPDQIAQRLDLARKVAAALGELPEAERRVLYLRYYEDASPPDIARALREPLGTVKSRLARGRELLRRRLDRECDDRGAWMGVLAPLAAIPPASVPFPNAPAAPAAASGPLLIGALTMATKTTVAVVASAALVSSLVVWRPWETRPAVEAVAPEGPALAPASVEGGLRPVADEPGGLVTSERVELVAAVSSESGEEGTTPGRIEVLATYGNDGSPASLLHGTLAPELDAWMEDEAPSARRFELDLEGRAVVAGLEPGDWVARLNGRAVETEAVHVAAGETVRAELSIRPGMDVRGLVLDKADSPVPGAEVFLSRGGDVPSVGTLAFSDGAGRFALRDLASWRQSGPWTEIAARAAGRVTSRAWQAAGEVGDVLEVVLRLEGIAGGLRGRMVDIEGAPVAGARIQLKSAGWSWERGLSAEGRRLGAQPQLRLESGPDGAFATDRLPAGMASVVVRSDEHPTWRKQVTIESGRTTELEVVLEPGGALEGIVLGTDGEAASGARISAGSPYADDDRYASADAAGHYRITGLHAGSAEVSAKVRFGREATGQVTIVAGQTTRWDPQLPASDRASGRVVDEAGEPLEGWGVHVIEPDRFELWLNSARTDAAGRFVLENCPEGPKALEVRLPEPFAAPPMLIVPFPTDPDVTLVVPDRARPSATLAGRVVDPSGVDVDGLELWLGAESFNWSKQLLPNRATQAFEFGPLAPGTYRLRAQAPGYVDLSLEGLELAPGEVRDLGALELVRGALLELTLELDLEPWKPYFPLIMAQLVAADGTLEGTWSLRETTWRSEQLAPGDWLLRVGGTGCAQRELVVHLAAGETTRVTLPAEPGTACFVRLEGLEPGDEVEIEVLDKAGAPFRGPVTRTESTVAIFGLSAGSWRVLARSGSGRSGELVLEIGSLEPVWEPLTLVLQ